MRYGSVCSGIEAATVAWHPLGWVPAFFSDIEAFPRSALRHHYPDVPLHGRDQRKGESDGDYAEAAGFQTIGADEYGPIELLVGGTPCQSFSIAGLRGGLGDDRGNLALEYLRLADRKRPRWLVWENVPGVLSSNGGRDFGAILGGMGELGYGIAYRILDAQHFGVPQRRRRVFVVGYLGDWRPAAAVLFERHSLSGHPAPRREKGKVAPTIPSRSTAGGGLGTDFDYDGGLIATDGQSNAAFSEDKALALTSHNEQPYVAYSATDCESGAFEEVETARPLTTSADRSRAAPVVFKASHFTRGKDGAPSEVVPPLSADADKGDQDNLVLQAPICFSAKDHGADASDIAPTLRAGGFTGSHANGGVMPAVAFDLRGREDGSQFEGPHDTANIRAASGGSSRPYVAASAVRRLTPRECERLQGFPDDYTLVPHRGRPAADGPRYRALGNSMAVPVMAFIGRRIQMVEDIIRGRDDAS